jgi:hypothetical protein
MNFGCGVGVGNGGGDVLGRLGGTRSDGNLNCGDEAVRSICARSAMLRSD